MPPFHRRFTWSTCSTFASPFTSNRARSPNTSDIELTRAIIRTTGGGDGTSSTHALHTCGNTYDHREDTKHKRITRDSVLASTLREGRIRARPLVGGGNTYRLLIRNLLLLKGLKARLHELRIGRLRGVLDLEEGDRRRRRNGSQRRRHLLQLVRAAAEPLLLTPLNDTRDVATQLARRQKVGGQRGAGE